MFKIVHLKDRNGTDVSVFTGCSETGYSAKDLMTVPGVYEECISSNGGIELRLSEIGGGGSFHTKGYALIIKQQGGVDFESAVLDLTTDTMRIFSLPTTAGNALLQSLPALIRDDVRQAVDAIRYYETVNENTKVCLPKEVMSELDPAIVKSMQSAKQTFILRATENQEIFQKTFDSEYGVSLPVLEHIHAEGGFNYNVLDLLRVVMPYRKPGTTPIYEPIYHTPFYRVGLSGGATPTSYRWIDGYSRNDLLDIQPNERHMQRNLYTLYQADVSRYVVDIASGVFFSSNYGTKIRRLPYTRDREAIDKLLSELREEGSSFEGAPSVSLRIPLDIIDELWNNNWQPSEVSKCIRDYLVLEDGYLEALIRAQHPARRIIVTSNLIFRLELTDEQEQKFTDLFIELGFMSQELQRFYLLLCQKAYCLNWGHTGVTKAIPSMILQSSVPRIAKEFSSYLQAREAGRAPIPQEYMSLYRGSYGDPTIVDDDEDIDTITIGNDSQDESVGMAFEYYVSRATANHLTATEVNFNSLWSRSRASMDSETRIIERWAFVNGEENLSYFLTTAHIQTCDIKIYIQAFIKLMRWGDRKPKVLVLQDHPEIRTVFDMGRGEYGENTVIVDENDLILVNGCDYSLAGFLNSVSNNEINPQHIVGFILEKNYGTVKKQYLAAWDDIAEMVEKCAINIGDLKTVNAIDVSSAQLIPIESFEDKAYDIYASDRSIQEGLNTWHVEGREMSSICLLTHKGITGERSYIRSTMNATVELLSDKKYDNLRRYIEALRRFYRAYGTRLFSMKTTVNLQELALLFGEIMQNGTASKQDQNAHAASSALNNMSLDLGGDTNSIEYDTSDLVGKFTVVRDPEHYTIKDNTWQIMTFTDPKLQGFANKVQLVLFLNKTSNGWVLCRKDIQSRELDRVMRPEGPKVSHVSYTKLRPLINKLLHGESAVYDGLPLKLHISAKLDQ